VESRVLLCLHLIAIDPSRRANLTAEFFLKNILRKKNTAICLQAVSWNMVCI